MKKFLIIFFILILDVFFIEPNLFVTNHEKMYLPNYQNEHNGLKIAVLSDLHIGTANVKLSKIEKIVEKVNNENPDIVFILGDFDAMSIINSNIPIEKIANVLNNFNAPLGVYAVLGNHDYEPINVVTNLLNKTNIVLLENEKKSINYNNKNLQIIGFKDLWHCYLSPNDIIGKTKPDESTIVLMHNPDTFPEINKKISLCLAGHTHGGEVFIPFLGSPFVPSEYHQRYRKGYVIENNKHLYVSGGIGTLSRMRAFNLPEISIFTLYKQDFCTKDSKISGVLNENYIPAVIKFKIMLKKIIG